MKLYKRPRQSGKTTELCDLVQDLDMLNIPTWVVVPSIAYKQQLQYRLRGKIDTENIKILKSSEAIQPGMIPPQKILCDEWYSISLSYRTILRIKYGNIITAWGTPMGAGTTGPW